MKTIIVAVCMLGASLAGDYYCEAAQDGDHDVRPRPEYDALQQEILLAPRKPVDGSMNTLGSVTTTNFGRYGFVNLTERAEPEVYFAP